MTIETVHCVGASEESAADIWDMAQDFTAPWHPLVDWMEREPATPGQIVRRFAAKGDNTVLRERLTYFSHSDRTLAYLMLEGISGAHRYEARLTVLPRDNGATLVWHAEIDAAPARAREIAAGTKVVFDAGIHALSRPSSVSRKAISLPPSGVIKTVQIGDTPALGVSFAIPQKRDTKTLCLFLHGIGGNRSNWDAQVTAMAGIMPTASLDLRGYGSSTLGFAPSQLDDYFDDIDQLRDHFSAEKLVLCGLSYGAWIAASYALRHPSQIAGLVLCGGCTGMSEADPDAREAFRMSREVPLDAGQTPGDFAPAVVDVIAGPDATPDVREALTASMRQIPPATYRDALRCFTNPLETLDFAKTDFPVLMMTGAHDTLAPPDEIRRVSHRFAKAGAPFVQFEVIADAGHVCNLEQPDTVNTHLAAFLRIVSPQPTTSVSAKATRQAEKRRLILEAALAEFSANGYSGASMQAIAARAGVSKPTLYQYIGQKDDMFRAVLEQGRATILAPFAQAEHRNMVDVLWEFAWGYAGYVLRADSLAISRLMIGEAERVPEIVRQYHETGPARALAGIAEYLETQRDAGLLAFETAEVAAEHLWALILSGPRNHALYFPQDTADQAILDPSIRNGLQVFLRAYATDPETLLKQLAGKARTVSP